MKCKFLQQLLLMSKLLFYVLVCQVSLTGMLLANSGQAQKKTSIKDIYLSISLEDTPVEQTLDVISEKTDFKFAFEQDIIEKPQSISIQASNESLADILLKVSRSTNLSFKRVNENIFVSKKHFFDKSVEEEISKIDEEEIPITGQVLSQDDNTGLPGVNVVVKGTSIGTVTDIDGNYSINVPGESSVLVFSSVGFITTEVVVGGQTTIDLSMETNLTSLDEIVVVGYGSVKKSDLTGSVASVKSEELNQFPTVNPVQALQGRVSGVQIQSTNGGEPGTGYSILIRGNSTINASNSPLFVVDGFPQATLPPADDIESIEVLKDASSTAIYGSRGSNGVVMITTKRGSQGKPKISYNASFSTQNEINKYDLLNATQYAEYMNELDGLIGNPPSFSNPSSLGAGTDWQEKILQTGHIQNHNLSVSGGNEDIRYYISGTVYDQKGIIINSGFQRYSLTSNVDAQLTNRLKAGVNLFARRANSNQISSREGTPGSQGGGVLTTALVFSPVLGVFENDEATYTTDPNLTGFDNPIAMAEERISEGVTDNLQSSIYAELEILKNLRFKTVLGVTITNDMDGSYQSSKLSYAGGFGGIARIDTRKNTSLLSENYLTYSTDIADGHSLTLLAGYSYQSNRSAFSSASGSGFLTDATEYWNLGSAATFERPNSNLTESELLSYYGRFNYSYKDRYLLTFTARRDGSSVLAEGNEWNFFPSGAVAWNVHNESFLSGSNVISQLKVRASHGVSGNQSVGAYSSLATLRYVFAVFNGSTVNAVSPQSLSNGELMWERTAQTDFGLDVGLYKDRFVFTADYYDMTTSNLLFDAPIPSYIGVGSSYLKNVGETGNKGVELSLQVRDIVKVISWNSSFNVAFNRNQVKKLPEEGEDIFYSRRPGNFVGINNTHVLREGEPLGLMYGYVYEGVQQSGEVVLTGAEGVGGEKFRDIEPDGVLDDNDRTIIGDPNPDFHWGWSNSFKFKGFDLDIFLQGIQGNDLLNYSRLWLEDGVGRRNVTTALLDRWTPSNTNTDVPRASTTRVQRLSSRWIEDGSYIRLKNISLGYSLPASLLSKLNVQSLRIYVSGQNLWTSTDYKGFDPEVSNSGAITRGIDFGSYPNTKNFTVGLNLGF